MPLISQSKSSAIRVGMLALVMMAGISWAAQADPTPPPRDNRTWEDDYDLDGDGKNDRILYKFSGGAHCCYEIGATLTSTHTTIWLPFWMDGGYILGLMTLLDRPDHFTIRTGEGALSEILMEISTYNGRSEPLPRSWKKRYGIKTHYIGISFPNGQVRVRDVSDWPSSHAKPE